MQGVKGKSVRYFRQTKACIDADLPRIEVRYTLRRTDIPVRNTLIALILSATAALAEDAPLRVAVFDMSFVNFSQEVEFGATNEAEIARIAMLSDYFRDLLEKSGRYDLLDTSELSDDLALHGNAFSCNNCEAALASKVGAERSFTGSVQKLSVLVQTIIVRERDTETGEVIRLYQTDIRNNTDEAWRRGLKWLVDNRLMVE